ncbi:MAG: hypothetical protein ACPG7U_01680 [Holosporaceae bacterium]
MIKFLRTIVCLACVVLGGGLSAAPLHTLIHLEKETNFCVQARMQFPALRDLFDFLQKTCLPEQAKVESSRATVLADKIKRYVAPGGYDEAVESFHSLKQKFFPDAVFWDKKTPEVILDEVSRGAALQASKEYPDDVAAAKAQTDKIFAQIKDISDLCAAEFDQAFKAIYGAPQASAAKVLPSHTLPQWNLFWAIVLGQEKHCEKPEIKPYLSAPFPGCFRVLRSMSAEDCKELYKLATRVGFVQPERPFAWWQNVEAAGEAFVGLKAFKTPPTLILACGKGHRVSALLNDLGVDEKQIMPWNRCCPHLHEDDTLTVDADPRQLPDVIADFCDEAFWSFWGDLPGNAVKEIIVEEERAFESWDQAKRSAFFRKLLQKSKSQEIKAPFGQILFQIS